MVIKNSLFVTFRLEGSEYQLPGTFIPASYLSHSDPSSFNLTKRGFKKQPRPTIPKLLINNIVKERIFLFMLLINKAVDLKL